jgi:hypothetical protein
MKKAPPHPFLYGGSGSNRAHLEHILKKGGSDALARYLALKLRLRPPDPVKLLRGTSDNGGELRKVWLANVDLLTKILDGKDEYFQITIKPRRGAKSPTARHRAKAIALYMEREHAAGRAYGSRKRMAEFFGVSPDTVKKTPRRRK